MGNQKGFLTLLGLLIVILIIGMIFSVVMSSYFQIAPANKKTGESISTPSVSTPRPKAILDSTRQKLQDSQRKILERQQQIIDK
jgi:hypothetical protein